MFPLAHRKTGTLVLLLFLVNECLAPLAKFLFSFLKLILSQRWCAFLAKTAKFRTMKNNLVCFYKLQWARPFFLEHLGLCFIKDRFTTYRFLCHADNDCRMRNIPGAFVVL